MKLLQLHQVNDKFFVFQLKIFKILLAEKMEEYHIEEAHRELVSTFRFTTYHEPLKRWPFNVEESLTKRVKTHGNFPRLLLEQSATKGISRNRKVLSA